MRTQRPPQVSGRGGTHGGRPAQTRSPSWPWGGREWPGDPSAVSLPLHFLSEGTPVGSAPRPSWQSLEEAGAQKS